MTLQSLTRHVHHVGLVVENLDEALEQHRRLFGLRSSHGPIVDPLQQVEIMMLELLDGSWVELLSPVGSSSPLAHHLEQGGGLNHVCYAVDDVNEAVERCHQEGCTIVSPPKPAVAFSGFPVAFLYAPAIQVFELVDARAVPPFCLSDGPVEVEGGPVQSRSDR